MSHFFPLSLKRMKQLPSRRIIVTHLRPDLLPPSIFQSKAKVSLLFASPCKSFPPSFPLCEMSFLHFHLSWSIHSHISKVEDADLCAKAVNKHPLPAAALPAQEVTIGGLVAECHCPFRSPSERCFRVCGRKLSKASSNSVCFNLPSKSGYPWKAHHRLGLG